MSHSHFCPGDFRGPRHLYSVITSSETGENAAEHFPTRAARLQSLRERIELFATVPASIDETALADTLSEIVDARIVLLESRWDQDAGGYLPVLRTAQRLLP